MRIIHRVNQDLFFNTNSHYITSNFELKSFNQYSTLEIEYLAIPKTRNQEIKIHLKDSLIKTIRNFDIKDKKVNILINHNINEITKIEYYIDNTLVESWG